MFAKVRESWHNGPQVLAFNGEHRRQMNVPKTRTSWSILYVTIAIVAVGFTARLLLPAFQVCRDPRMPCANNLKAIGFALHHYHEVYGTFPPAYTVDQNGNRLHSWRTLLLPYLGQKELYDRIKLDEPWDSLHNRQIAEVKLPAYACPRGDGGLSYLAVATSGSLFEGGHVLSFSDIADGTGNTVAMIEVNPLSVSWMQPVDFDQRDLDRVLAEGLSSPHANACIVLFADGSIRIIPAKVDRQTFEAWLTYAGGEDVDSSCL